MAIQLLNSNEIKNVSGALTGAISISDLDATHFAPSELLTFEIVMDLVGFLENENYEGYYGMVNDMIADNPELSNYNWNHVGITF